MSVHVCVTIAFVLASAFAAQAQETGPTPQECRAALGVEIPVKAEDTRVLRDTPAIILAEEIQHLLDTAAFADAEALRQFTDSLTAAHGKDLLRRASLMMLTGFAKVESYTEVGYFYALFGGDARYAEAIAFDPGSTMQERYWAVSALGTGADLGLYGDSTSTFAVAAVMCDMAYLLRPFVGDDPEWLVRQGGPASHYSIKTAHGLFYTSLSTLGFADLPSGSQILEAYAAWEPNPDLRAWAADVLERSVRQRSRGR